MKFDFLKNSFSQITTPLILGVTILLLDRLSAPAGLSLFFNFVMLFSTPFLLARVLKSNLGNWLNMMLLILGIGMPLFAIANIFSSIAPFLEVGLVRFLGYLLITIVVSLNFFSLILSIRLEKKVLNKLEVLNNENTKNNVSTNSSVYAVASK